VLVLVRSPMKIMMEEVDKDGNGTIDYEEFVNFFLAK